MRKRTNEAINTLRDLGANSNIKVAVTELLEWVAGEGSISLADGTMIPKLPTIVSHKWRGQTVAQMATKLVMILDLAWSWTWMESTKNQLKLILPDFWFYGEQSFKADLTILTLWLSHESNKVSDTWDGSPMPGSKIAEDVASSLIYASPLSHLDHHKLFWATLGHASVETKTRTALRITKETAPDELKARSSHSTFIEDNEDHTTEVRFRKVPRNDSAIQFELAVHYKADGITRKKGFTKCFGFSIPQVMVKSFLSVLERDQDVPQDGSIHLDREA